MLEDFDPDRDKLSGRAARECAPCADECRLKPPYASKTAPAPVIGSMKMKRSSVASRPRNSETKKLAGGSHHLPQASKTHRTRYGRLTVVASPLAEIVNTPDVVLDVSAYALQPEGGAGTVDMNGPATWF
jgi:hypothetical protein